MTVLSADFQRFTEFAANRDAEEVHEFINLYRKELAPLIEAHGGCVEKYIGDAILALFGAEKTHEDDPAQAVRAALAMQERLRQIEASGQRLILPMRIGIHTGLVVIQADPSGGGFSAAGDTVNVTDRLQKKAPPGQVLISQDTFRHVHGLFDVHPAMACKIDGKPDPLLARIVIRARPRASANLIRGVEGAVTRMVGRDLEMHHLQTALTNTLERRQVHMVTVSGEAGMGKSRLLREFLKWVDLIPEDVFVFSSRATAEMSNAPFALWRDLLTARFSIHDTDSAAAAREKLEKGVDELLREESAPAQPGDSSAETVAHFMGRLAGLDFPASPHLPGSLADSRQFHQRAFALAGHFFSQISGEPERAGGRRAVLVVADDFHWSDEGSMNLFEHLAAACQGRPLFILCLTRPEFFERHPGWGDKFRLHTLIRLTPLAGADTRSLIEQIFECTSQIPSELSERIAGLAEGNPFYVEEIIKMVLERGGFRPEPGAAAKMEFSTADTLLPPTLTGVLQARLDALAPLERAAAQRASVLGRVFWDNALQHLRSPEGSSATDRSLDGRVFSSSELSEALAGLVRKQIIFRQPGTTREGAIEYSFTHDLLRGVAYQGLLKKDRQRLHLHAALWLISHGGERATESAGIIAAHFENAGRAAEAAEWHGHAGRQAMAGHIPAMAAASFSRAIELSAPLKGAADFAEKRLDWLEGLAQTLAARAEFDRARETYEKMRGEAEAANAPIAEARSWNGLAFLRERQGNNLESIEAANRAIELSRRAGPAGRTALFHAIYQKAWAHYRLADAAQVLELAEESAALARELDDRAAMGRAFKLHGVAHLQLSHYDEAERCFRLGLELALSTGDLRTAAAMWSNRGETARARGDFGAAVSLYENALAISRKIGSRESELVYLVNISAARIGLRQFAQAEADLRAVIPPAESAQLFGLSELYTLLSDVCREQGKSAEAVDSARHALQLSRTSGNSLHAADAWRALALALTAGDSTTDGESSATREDPEFCFQESARIFKHMRAEGEWARTLNSWAQFDIARARNAEARTKLAEACKCFQQLNMTEDFRKAERLLQPIS